MGLWGLPQTLVEAVAFHHEPSRYPSQTFTPLTAVHVANLFLGAAQMTGQSFAEGKPLDKEYLANLGLSGERILAWRAYLGCGDAKT